MTISSSSSPATIVLLGAFERPEFRTCFDVVLEHGQRCRLELVPDVASLFDQLQSQAFRPDLAIVLQSWPDEFSNRDVTRLFQLCPLARWVCCYGPWCEADGRNSKIWPIATRVAARSCRDRLESEFDVLSGARDAVPLTASREELARWSSNRQQRQAVVNATIQIESIDAEWRDSVAEILRDYRAPRAGSERLVNSAQPRITVWDADPWNAAQVDKLLRYREAQRVDWIVAAFGMHYPNDRRRLSQCGIDRVVSKMHLATELPPAVMAFAD